MTIKFIHKKWRSIFSATDRSRPLVDVAFLWVARLASSLATIAVLAVAARSVSLDTFAEFALLIGLVGWLPVLDFGFGSVMQNRVAYARAHGNYDAAAVTACLIGAALIAALSGLALIIIIFIFDLELSSVAIFRRPGVIAFTIVCLLLSGVAMIVHKLYAATNQLKKSSLILATQNILSLAGVWLALKYQADEPKIISLLFGYFVPYTLVPALALVQIIRKIGWSSNWKEVWRSNELLKEALQFWFVLLLSLIVIQFDQFIAFTYLSPTDFSQYTVSTKLIGFMYFPYSALLTANWSRMSAAHAMRNKNLMLSIVRSSIFIGVGYLALALPIMLAVSEYFSYILPQGARQVELGMLIGLGLVAINKVWTESYALVYLATGHARIIATYLPFQAMMAVGLQLVLVRYLGAYGLMLGCALSYFATSHWILYFRKSDVFKSHTSEKLTIS
ncbi:hypothetical protein N5C43_00280 [Comamonas terrigena]|uniref:lipopolysaccharide biosynthesis protein n=1 Tax=Comamonas terrigena TaxID=32013 RepID=UPI00244B3E5B|nr:hypothetical protein [Comamonas terrigena]MDH1289692.1 hypothetical protein [Comamonas terrigena]